MNDSFIGKVEHLIKDGFTRFYRVKLLFAKVQQEELYFLNSNYGAVYA